MGGEQIVGALGRVVNVVIVLRILLGELSENSIVVREGSNVVSLLGRHCREQSLQLSQENSGDRTQLISLLTP